jgi:uncharacterized protein
MTENAQAETTTLVVDIGGMHCPNCETLVERRFKAIAGVRTVDAHATNGTATIHHEGSVDIAALQASLLDDGYTVHAAGDGPSPRNTGRDYAEITAVFAILFGLYLLLKQFNVLPSNIGVREDTSLGLAFVIGLVASVSTCMAVTGGMLVAAAAKYNETVGDKSGLQRLKPLLFFNAGRIGSYTFFGAAIGALGSAFQLSSGANGIITLIVSAIMIVFGLQMLKLLPSFARFMPRWSKTISHKLHDLAGREAKGGAFVLGAATFFLPCGFTQALQLYVLASANAVTGALTMLAFALGTLPALMSLSTLSSFASGGFQRHFLKFAGAAVVVLGIINIQYGLTLSGSTMQPAAQATPSAESSGQPIQSADQTPPKILKMTVLGTNYLPHRFTVTEGQPVEWQIDGEMAQGCGHMLIAPGLGIRTILEYKGDTVVRFVPSAPGEYAFNCGMGMMTKNSAIIVVPRS